MNTACIRGAFVVAELPRTPRRQRCVTNASASKYKRRMTSKSFRAELPALNHKELERLRRWGAENCAESILYRDGACVLWLVSRGHARAREDFARAVRALFRKLSIDATKLKKGHWLTLTHDEVVRAERSSLGCTPAEAAPAGSAASSVGEGADDKVIALTSRGRGCRRARALAIIKDS